MLVEVAADIKAKAPFLKPNILPKNANAVLKTIIFLFSDKCNQKNNQPEKRHKKNAPFRVRSLLKLTAIACRLYLTKPRNVGFVPLCLVNQARERL